MSADIRSGRPDGSDPDGPTARLGTADPVDLVGVGYGPAALAVATALDDAAEEAACARHGAAVGPQPTALFLERAKSSAWQPDMLLPGTDIQHHFLRDLAGPRNPRSRFTFPNYLKEVGRLYPFTLLGGYVSRQEWSAYVEWVATSLDQPVRYRQEVLEVAPVTDDDGVVRTARVVARDTATGATATHLARNVLVSTGHQPYVPELFADVLGERVFHSSGYLAHLRSLPREANLRIAVVGAGQNAGEALLHLASAYPQARITSLARNSGFRLYNLGHFSNEAYFPGEVDYFYALDRGQRESVFAEVHSTNYAGVDPDVSTGLYQLAYEDRHFGPGRLDFRRRVSVEACEPTPSGAYKLTTRQVHSGAVEELEADVVVLCTGFREPRFPALLEPLRRHVRFDEYGDPLVTRAFRLETGPECTVGVYLNGITEWRHGINSATSFSTIAVRAEQILTDLAAHRTEDTPGRARPVRPAPEPEPVAPLPR
ncbi:SidA/IucD/PvdA family monooxygenase [Actinacidiphila acididurans]|uniref:L-lysine N6-monooxygenase MbtG n=1 Tax=Actinacidiphila acididurans TaxID=2784346 RepID=A0ABS2TLA3_9ACTN|nr:SidA/IucD/PvdA family monooxygenase [Actinacidiphila acididurans]MBM9504115.1 SidA/IucD/PvdA family monooxygenase [Actinacidiphila acididurans]